jgi:hypothetical protein
MANDYLPRHDFISNIDVTGQVHSGDPDRLPLVERN